jgi:hypothetical protein
VAPDWGVIWISIVWRVRMAVWGADERVRARPTAVVLAVVIASWLVVCAVLRRGAGGRMSTTTTVREDRPPRRLARPVTVLFAALIGLGALAGAAGMGLGAIAARSDHGSSGYGHLGRFDHRDDLLTAICSGRHDVLPRSVRDVGNS